METPASPEEAWPGPQARGRAREDEPSDPCEYCPRGAAEDAGAFIFKFDFIGVY